MAQAFLILFLVLYFTQLNLLSGDDSVFRRAVQSEPPLDEENLSTIHSNGQKMGTSREELGPLESTCTQRASMPSRSFLTTNSAAPDVLLTGVPTDNKLSIVSVTGASNMQGQFIGTGTIAGIYELDAATGDWIVYTWDAGFTKMLRVRLGLSAGTVTAYAAEACNYTQLTHDIGTVWATQGRVKPVERASAPGYGVQGLEIAVALVTCLDAPTAVLTAVPNLGPTIPTIYSSVIESDHRHGRNTNEMWTIEYPGVDCYVLKIDPQSWTRDRTNYMKIFLYKYIKGSRVLSVPLGRRLYKKRLLQVGTTQVRADGVQIEFRTDNSRTSWGFRLNVSSCPS